MLCKCSGKYIDIYFILKITYLNDVITAKWGVREPPRFLEEDCWSISAGHFTPVNHIPRFERFPYRLTLIDLLFLILMDYI